MKSLARLLISHVFISIFVTFFLLSGHIEHPFLIIFLLFLPVLNKGQRFQKIQSKKIRLLNASLCFILVSFPQLLTNPMDWRYLVFLIICIIFSLVYFYTLYQLFKEVNQKSLIQEVTPMKKEDFTTRLLLPPTLLVLSPIWTLHRVGSRGHALPLFWTYLRPLIQGETSSSRLTFGQGRPVRNPSQKLQQKSNQSSQLGCIHQYSNWLVCLISLSQTLCSASSPQYLLGQSLPVR